MLSVVLTAVLACQGAPAPSPSSPAPAPTSTSPNTAAPKAAPPAATSSDTLELGTLYRDWGRRDDTETSAAPADGTYRCRRTATTVTCGTSEESMRQSEEEAKALLDRMLSPD